MSQLSVGVFHTKRCSLAVQGKGLRQIPVCALWPNVSTVGVCAIKNLHKPIKMCQRHRQRKDKRGKDRMKWEIEEPVGSVILCGLRLWQNYPPRRTTVAADIRFWFPGKALTSYGYMVLPQTNTVTDAYISTGMCALERVCMDVSAHALRSRRWSHFVIDGVGA